ncbi:hypothetical protein [Chryseobacterium sp.]
MIPTHGVISVALRLQRLRPHEQLYNTNWVSNVTVGRPMKQ